MDQVWRPEVSELGELFRSTLERLFDFSLHEPEDQSMHCTYQGGGIGDFRGGEILWDISGTVETHCEEELGRSVEGEEKGDAEDVLSWDLRKSRKGFPSLKLMCSTYLKCLEAPENTYGKNIIVIFI